MSSLLIWLLFSLFTWSK